jgi:hypothetical protein
MTFPDNLKAKVSSRSSDVPSWRVPLLLAVILVLTCVFLPGEEAAAQQTSCARIERDIRAAAEADKAERPDQLRRQAQRVSGQAQKLRAQIAQTGCEGTRFLIFGSDPPPQCASMTLRAEQLERRASALLLQAEQPSNRKSAEARLRRLEAAYESRNCAAEQQQAQNGDAPLPPVDGVDAVQPDGSRPVVPITRSDEEQRAASYATGGGAPGAVCVRHCDGYFFPLSGARSRSEANAMCQAQCPATETSVYYRRGAAIASAFSQEGASYSQLPNAFAYQKSFNPECACRQPGESWAQALQQAESMVSSRGKPDLVVDEAMAAKWATVQAGLLKGKGGKKNAEPQPAAEETAVDDSQPKSPEAAGLRAARTEEPAIAEAPQTPATPAQPDDAPTAGIGDDDLGKAIQSLDREAENEPLPEALIDPAEEGRETVLNLPEMLPAPQGDQIE